MTTAPLSSSPSADDDLLTIDELAAAVGTTVRTTRYYATLGLVPPPVRRGRVGYYGPVHRARLELVRALQDHGFTLQAIEGFVRDVPDDASVEELALQRAMLTSWTAKAPEEMTRRELDRHAGRKLGEADLAVLKLTGAVQETAPDVFVVMAHLPVGLGLLDVDVPTEALGMAEDAIRRHMAALADELTAILHTQVIEPFRAQTHSPDDARRLEHTMGRLRQLTLESVVTGFQRAANQVITRSLGGVRPPTP